MLSGTMTSVGRQPNGICKGLWHMAALTTKRHNVGIQVGTIPN